jgi:hypothetical protein
MLKLIKIFFVAILLSSNAFAASDGDLELSKKIKQIKIQKTVLNL